MTGPELVKSKSGVSVTGEENKAYYCMYLFRYYTHRMKDSYIAVMYDLSTQKIFPLELNRNAFYNNYEFYGPNKKLSSVSRRELVKMAFDIDGRIKVEQIIELAEKAGLME